MTHDPLGVGEQPEPIDPDVVPAIDVGGALMPAVGLGTFGSDAVDAHTVADSVGGAVRLGYRHLDCARVYGNEAQIGRALRRLDADGIGRDQLWITSKVWNDRHHDVERSCEDSLRDLGVDHLDLFLVHWPFPNHHEPGVDVGSRDHDAQPYVHEQYMDTWAQMERLVDRGLVRSIGTSNMTVPKLERVVADARIAPVANEMELHPHFQQPELFAWCVERGIQPIGFSPLGSPGRPERARTAEDSDPMSDPVVRALAESHGVHPASICIAWAVQRGQVPIPFSTNPRNQRANLLASTMRLTSDEMQTIADADRDCRLIKGQVFLWRDGQDWRDLWDVDGRIAT